MSEDEDFLEKENDGLVKTGDRNKRRHRDCATPTTKRVERTVKEAAYDRYLEKASAYYYYKSQKGQNKGIKSVKKQCSTQIYGLINSFNIEKNAPLSNSQLKNEGIKLM